MVCSQAGGAAGAKASAGGLGWWVVDRGWRWCVGPALLARWPPPLPLLLLLLLLLLPLRAVLLPGG